MQEKEFHTYVYEVSNQLYMLSHLFQGKNDTFELSACACDGLRETLFGLGNKTVALLERHDDLFDELRRANGGPQQCNEDERRREEQRKAAEKAAGKDMQSGVLLEQKIAEAKARERNREPFDRWRD